VIGAQGVVRIEPYNTGLRVYGDSGVSDRAWVDASLVRTLPQWRSRAQRHADESGLERAGPGDRIMEMIGSVAVIPTGGIG